MLRKISFPILSLLFCYNFAQADTVLFSGEPAFSKLSPNVKQNKLFANAPQRHVTQTNLLSHIVKRDKYYSHYQMNPTITSGFMTKYWTKEDVKDGSGFNGMPYKENMTINGRGISYGGIFWPLELMTANDKNGNQIYFNEVDINSMKYISGTLFPLKVGNDLKFNFTRTHERIVNGKKTIENDVGIMEYKVVDEFSGYSYSKNPVPGNIFTIEVWETTNNHPQKYLTDIYDYSEYFAWYITDKYFTTNNKNTITYRLGWWH